MLSIADVEKQLASQRAEAQKIKEEAKAKLTAAKAEETAEQAIKAATDKTEETVQLAVKKINETQDEAKKILSDIKNIDGQIEKFANIKNLTDQAQKELKKLEDLRSQNFEKWVNTVLSSKGIEQTLTSEMESKVTDTIHKISQDLLSMRLEEDMQKELDKLKAAGKVTEEKFTQMIAVIRGHKTVAISQAPIITDAVSQIDKYIKDYVEKQSKDLLNKLNVNNSVKTITNSVSSALAKEKKIYDSLKQMSEKLKNYEGMSESEAALTVAKSIEQGILKKTNIDSFFKNIDAAVKEKTGGVIDSKKLFAPVLGKININVGEKISAKLQPLIKQHVKTIEQITTKIAKLQARIVAAEKAFKDAVQKYQDMANNFIQEQTKQLADKISKELGINLAGALGGISGGIKLSI
jgi:hypothetical protein